MITKASLVADLQSIVGSEYAYAPKDVRRFAVDGLNPEAVVEPGSYEDVAAVMRFANERGLAVIPRGHDGFLAFIGNIPHRYDISLKLARLSEIIEYEPADLTITCQAGTTLADIHHRLAVNKQMIPFGSKSEDTRCVGGLLATNLRGSNLTYGSARDFTIGMRVVTAEGRITRAGGKVVKNVAGYDLCKLFIGSFGTLGVIVEASFKLAPLPQAEEAINLEFVSLREPCDVAVELRRRGLSLWNVNIHRPVSLTEEGCTPLGPHVLRLWLAGTTAAVERSRREIQWLAQETGAKPYDYSRLPTSPARFPAWASKDDALSCEASVLPSQIPSLVEAFDGEAPGAFVTASPLEGTVAATWLGVGAADDLVHALRAVTSTMGGSLVVTGCSTELKRRIDVFGDPPPSFDLMRRIKQQFDSKGTLSPGRFIGRL